ncbi:hypothetical protein MMC18_007136 [Xylographa bjoerkii]|nr:hypothetical protein [Xylographa bjoerkii]
MADDDTVFALDLVDDLSDDEKGATPKITFWGSNHGIQQGENLVNVNIARGGQVVQCGMSHICHGTWVPQGSPATLIVMQFVFLPFGQNRRFQSAEITMTFSPGRNSTVSPEVMALSPEGKYGILPSIKTDEVSHMINPTIKATMGLAEAGVDYQWQHKTSIDREKSATVSGIKLKKNVAFWALYENPDTQTMPTFLQTAVLLRRERCFGIPLGERFTATLKIVAKVDRLAWLKDKVVGTADKKISRTLEKDNVLRFDPKNSKGTISGLDNLSMKEPEIREFQQLVTIKEWVDGGSKPKEGEMQGMNSASQESQRQEKLPLVAAALPAQYTPFVDENQEAATDSDPIEQLSTQHAEPTALLAEITSQSSALITQQPDFQLAALERTAEPTVKEKPLVAEVPDLETSPQMGKATEAQPYTRQPEAQPLITKSHSVSTDGRLAVLLDRLGRVRVEANLLRRLISLEEEERRILQEIMQMEGQSSLTDKFSSC